MKAMAKGKSADPPGSVDGYKHGRVPREVRRGQLLVLAEQLFMEKGYGGFSIDDLCRAAGVSRPIVYEHFGSKDGIYLACLRGIRSEFESALLAAAGPTPGKSWSTRNPATESLGFSAQRSAQRTSFTCAASRNFRPPNFTKGIRLAVSSSSSRSL